VRKVFVAACAFAAVLADPFRCNGDFIGCAGTSITLDVLTRFLAMHRASPHSTTIIADLTDGKIIAASEKQKGVRLADGKLEIARLENFADDDVREAYRLQTRTNENDFLLRSPRDGQELSASFARFPESFGRPWEAIVITPTDDFIGQPGSARPTPRDCRDQPKRLSSPRRPSRHSAFKLRGGTELGEHIALDSVRSHLCPACAFSRSRIGHLAEKSDHAQLLRQWRVEGNLIEAIEDLGG
jgi:hypothetical protein